MPGEVRLVLVRKTHVDLEHPAARGTDKMMVVFSAGFLADEEKALPVIAVHAVHQPAAHEPVDRPVDGGKTDWAPKRLGQGILDLLGRVGALLCIETVQERRDYGGYPSAVIAEYLEVLGGEFGVFSWHTSSRY
jgi:hypothetical protein